MNAKKVVYRFKKLMISPKLCLDDAYLAIKNGYLVEYGIFSKSVVRRFSGFVFRDISKVATPGFVNAHTHLVFSNLVAREKYSSFLEFVKFLSERTKNWTYKEYENSYKKGLMLLKNSNSTLTIDFVPFSLFSNLVKFSSPSVLQFPEFIVSQSSIVNKVIEAINRKKIPKSKFIALHSLYSVHKKFIEEIVKIFPTALYSLHFAEFEDEKKFLTKGEGLVLDLFRFHNRNISDFYIPYVDLVEYFYKLPIFSNKLLLVHCNYLDEKEIRRLSYFNAVFVKCFQSSSTLGNNFKNVEIMVKEKVKLALGTDSLASAKTIDVLEEAKFLYKNFKVSLEELWKYLMGYYLNGLIDDYSFGFFMTGKKFLLNVYNIKCKDAFELLEGLLYTKVLPVFKIP